MSEANRLTNELLIAIPKRFPDVICWRANTGGAVGMATVKLAVDCITKGQSQAAQRMLRRPTKFGINGQADISGIGPRGIRIELEIKAGRDTQSSIQKSFAAMIQKAGGVYLVVRDVEKGLSDLGDALAACKTP